MSSSIEKSGYATELDMRGHRVWKFGGSSLRNAERIEQVTQLILDHGLSNKCFEEQGFDYIRGDNADSLIIVVSAIAGVTNLLVEVSSFKRGEADFVSDKMAVLDQIVTKHKEVLQGLIALETLSIESGDWAVDRISNDCFSKIKSLLEACAIIGNVPAKISEIIKGFGEIWSSMICSLSMQHKMSKLASNLSPELNECISALDSTDCPGVVSVIRRPGEVDSSAEDKQPIHVTVLAAPWNCQKLIQLQKPFLADEAPTVDMELSKKRIYTAYSSEFTKWVSLRGALSERYQSSPSDILIRCLRFTTGFVCRDHEGASATLGRNGSDYTGSILANCLQALSYTIWSDVEGVFTADPRIIPEARCVPVLSYEEAMELSFFGASVIHPLTMQPLISADIPIFMKSSYFPMKQGTVICRAGRTMEVLSKTLTHNSSTVVQRSPTCMEEVTFAGVPIRDLAVR
eukprot:GHVH01010654.1.p1 GENE.GHVH01010654.1~~GHVH01010654.1.p1  ORF type:complete len:459 (-),score=67.70 GHVH01010654.1:600-1976(-)